MKPRFIHLRLHSEYSLVDGVVRIPDLVATLADTGMPACAITDQNNLFALVKYYRACINKGIKPIIGVDLWLHNEQDIRHPHRLVLLCKDRGGYIHLSELISRAYLEGQHNGIPIIEQAWLQDGNSDGLIALSGGREGDVGRALLAGNQELAGHLLQKWQQLFPDAYYLELQRTGRVNEEEYIHAAVTLAGQQRIPVVATNDVHFIHVDDFEAHEARVCIHDGRTLDDTHRPHNYTSQQYLRSEEEMLALFDDLPEALENTVEIALRCNLELTLGKNYLPDFPVPEGLTMDAFFRAEAWAGLEKRLAVLFDPSSEGFTEQRKPYDERLEIELGVIIEMGFPGYFLIVADFIRWAKNNAIPVGPGRGSGAGSLVAYVLTITNLDPLEFDLLFERFLNPERVSMPDFDIDFCMEGRDRVIEYVAQTYGREKVSQIITYGSMAAKAVVRDVGRVLGKPYGFVDTIAKLIPFEIGITLDKALEQEPQLAEKYNDEEEVRELIDLAKSLEGLSRNAGKHAGGVVIAPSKLTDFTPLYCEQGSTSIVSQFDKDDVEAVGLVKFDFLGLRTLTIIDWALQTINRQRAEQGLDAIDIDLIPTDDKASFDLLKACNTTAVFQLESSGMKDLIRRLQPDNFEDVVALVALFRPGPLQSGMVDDFVERKHGRARIVYPHPDLEDILKPTYGVILYQEQVMQIAQVLANYSLGGADILRRAMGKKKASEMAKQRTIFTEGATARGVEESVATYIFDLMEKFAGYGFNKSHSAAYALVAYQTAWMKAHYPAEFMAAVLSADMDNTDKVVTLIDDCASMDIDVVPPDVNRSYYAFTVNKADDKDQVIYGLGAIKGVGQAAIEGLIKEREENGSFGSLFDLCQRVDLKKLNRRVLDALIRACALDGIGPNRASLMQQLPSSLRLAEQRSRDDLAGQNDLFGGGDVDETVEEEEQTLEIDEWDETIRLQGERDTLGLYLTGHPVSCYQDELAQFISGRIVDLMTGAREGSIALVAGLVIDMRVINPKNNRGRLAFLTLDDRSGRIEVRVQSKMYEQYQAILARDKILVISGKLDRNDYSGGNYQVSAEQIMELSEAREIYAECLSFSFTSISMDATFVSRLVEVLQPYREGKCRICVDYQNTQAAARLQLGGDWLVHPSDELITRLRAMPELDQVLMEYKSD
ncbi:MAG: DNA polymerase III subunit alpha [Gammaproteobacteria bacterium]|nr:DNA polymerase III subunit alpha [Gammaproteobacteria bacterium]